MHHDHLGGISHPTDYPFDNARVCKLWHKLHARRPRAATQRPPPAKRLSWFHAGAFQQAADAAWSWANRHEPGQQGHLHV